MAERLLAPLGRRWVHVRAVAKSAQALRRTVGPSDSHILVAAAWLHDIGYSPQIAYSRFHPLDGARHLLESGWPARIVNLVAHHSGARFEAVERGLAKELARFELEDSPVMDALITADLTTGPDGATLRYRDRISEIRNRYPAAHPVHRAWLKAADPLEESIRRVNERLTSLQLPNVGI